MHWASHEYIDMVANGKEVLNRQSRVDEYVSCSRVKFRALCRVRQSHDMSFQEREREKCFMWHFNVELHQQKALLEFQSALMSFTHYSFESFKLCPFN